MHKMQIAHDAMYDAFPVPASRNGRDREEARYAKERSNATFTGTVFTGTVFTSFKRSFFNPDASGDGDPKDIFYPLFPLEFFVELAMRTISIILHYNIIP